ncbi:aromatic compound dioxygenase [Aspergillus japonicus CBS 114.51]|uniref:Aromatic compound dioxygenase n=1 Tax=Aspergillus japonicus CBS 114.51 TaxID=1448312 RepID=A0A8T8WMV1_ASPJA|nr:aromatic compound dioxygenase [Aspergillus japonicus CBS 114.51]RAH77188.1 aromatic compound dioxygenase [Aspergillus japonicus CBS 114.51]
MRIAGLWAIAVLPLGAVAHPGHDMSQELAHRRGFLAQSKRTDLSHCASKLQARGVESRNLARRYHTLHAKKQKRDLDSVLDTSHNETDLGYTPTTAERTVFSSNTSCALTPEATQGPYYITGEKVRRNVVEDQVGVPLTLDLQVVDIDTCNPVSDVWLEIWSCNSTGVYSGVVAAANGDGTDDLGNIDTTFLRGIQRTDADGVVQFDTLFPGHYTDRATHLHILIHHNATELKNHTLGSGNATWVTHVGQAFFDQELISAVEETYPYTANTQVLTKNADDAILASEASLGADPVVDYAYLDSNVPDGLFAWMSFGINVTKNYEISASGSYWADGGRPEDNSQWTALPPDDTASSSSSSSTASSSTP